MGFGVVESLYLFVNGDGYDPGLTWDIATDHQYNAEFSDGMGKGQYTRANKPTLAQR